MQARLTAAIATGERLADEYTFESLALGVEETVAQTSAGLVFDGQGSVDHVLYDPLGVEMSRSSDRFETTFILRQVAGERWLIVAVVSGDG
jgi:hypothetical protein